MAYKIGDKVRIKKDFDKTSNIFSGNMRKYLGKVMTIIEITGDDYIMKEDQGEGPKRYDGRRYWYWNDTMISGICNPKSIAYGVLV